MISVYLLLDFLTKCLHIKITEGMYPVLPAIILLFLAMKQLHHTLKQLFHALETTVSYA